MILCLIFMTKRCIKVWPKIKDTKAVFHSEEAALTQSVRLWVWEEFPNDFLPHLTTFFVSLSFFVTLTDFFLIIFFFFFFLFYFFHQLSFKKYKNHQAPLRCEKFIERASRPQELISIELLDVSENRNPDNVEPFSPDSAKKLFHFSVAGIV